VFFNIRDLELRPAPFDVELAAGAIEFPDLRVRQAGPLKAVGHAEMVSSLLDEVRVKGHVSVLMQADCDRCLEPADCPVDEDFELYYRPASEALSEEKELAPGEAEVGFYEGDGVELNDVLREFVLLALPMQKLCRADCKGICHVCGQNRNLKECQCQAEAADDRWAALKSIRN
jgi:uncharacterized protein